MVKTKKPGVTHKGKVQKVGALLSLSHEDEARLVREGWCAYVESWPAGNNPGEPKTPEIAKGKDNAEKNPEKISGTAEAEEKPNAEEEPDTALPEEKEALSRNRGRKK